MRDDYQYAQLLEMMRSQGAKDNPTLAQLGVTLRREPMQ